MNRRKAERATFVFPYGLLQRARHCVKHRPALTLWFLVIQGLDNIVRQVEKDIKPKWNGQRVRLKAGRKAKSK